MRSYGLRATLFSVALCAALLVGASLWLGLVGAAAVSALLVALGWIIYFHSERKVLTALRARPVSEVERPDLYRIVRELAFPRAPALCPACSCHPRRSRTSSPSGTARGRRRCAAPRGCSRLLSLGRAPRGARPRAGARRAAGLRGAPRVRGPRVARRVLPADRGDAAHHRPVRAASTGRTSTGRCSPVTRWPWSAPCRKSTPPALAQPLRPRGTLAAASHLMIAHPFPSHGLGGMLSSHPPTSERFGRLEALSGGPRLLQGQR